MKGLRVQLLAGDEEGACVLDGDEYFAEIECMRHSQPALPEGLPGHLLGAGR